MPTISGCGGAASRPRGSATSRPRSASRRPTASTSRDARALGPRRAQPDGAAAVRRASTRSRWSSRTGPRATFETMEVVQQPRGPVRRRRARSRSARELWIEREDFMEEPAAEVLPARARAARSGCGTRTSSPARRSSRTPTGAVVELRCTYDPATRGGDSPDGRRPKATLHWVSAAHAVPAEVRLYDHLFTRPDPGADGDLFADLNPASETIVRGAMLEPSLADAQPGRDRPVRAAGLLRAGHGLATGRARVQPDADAQGHLGEGAGQGLTSADARMTLRRQRVDGASEGRETG